MTRPRFQWLHATLCGLLLAVVITVAVSLTQPIGALAPGEIARVAVSVLLNYAPVGLIWAYGAKLASESGRPRLMLFATLSCAWATAVGMDALPVTRAAAAGGDGAPLFTVPLLDLACYSLWLNLFYGGLYALGFVNARRLTRMRRCLSQLRLARDEAEADMREARLRAVQGQIQPELLLEALRELQIAYDRDPEQGDRLFDALISFLRAAMPSLRGGASTLKGELALMESYGALRLLLRAGAPVWRLALGAPAQDAPFPAVHLLPALDRASRALPAGAALEIEARNTEDAFRLRIGATPALSDELAGALCESLRRDLAVAVAVSTGAPPPWLCELTFAAHPA